MNFSLSSPFSPTGDQPEAIHQLSQGLAQGTRAQVLQGVTGSGKTFTVANVIAHHNRPTLVLSHNKTLAAQLYAEFRDFFPNNAVEYYVSYYDYYQPEAYLPATDLYIEKDLSINEEIDRLRLRAVSALLSGRQDVIIVSSVSCIYGMGGPLALQSNISSLRVGETLDRSVFLRQLVDALYTRNDLNLTRGTFRVRGETVDVFPAYSDSVVRITWWDNTIESIAELSPSDFHRISSFQEYHIYPANIFLTTHEQQERAIVEIKKDLEKQVQHFTELGEDLYAQRLQERVTYDMEFLAELGHCSGIENYSRYFDGRAPGERPFCLLDFFPPDFLLVVDESHVTIPQLIAMYGGDRARKQNLVQYGFRLPAAFDNRPLRFEEFQSMVHQVIYVSATPADFELSQAEGVVVEQIIRPTGLLDPDIEVRPTTHVVDDLMEEIIVRADRGERTLVTTLTKRMAEELARFFLQHNVRANYIHSEVSTLDRVSIMNDLRAGVFDVLVGVNLLREGLDLPEVSLVAIIDADKEGFLRSHRSMTQTAGRAARHVHGHVILYADTVTESMRLTIAESRRRREIQQEYNRVHHITPHQIHRDIKPSLAPTPSSDSRPESKTKLPYLLPPVPVYPDSLLSTLSATQLESLIQETTTLMNEAAARLEFLQAAQYRDEVNRLREMRKGRERKGRVRKGRGKGDKERGRNG